MKVSTPILHAMALGAARIIPELGDSEPSIPSIIYPTIECLSQTGVLGAASNVESDQSILISAATLVAPSTAAATITAATLKKGLYTLDLSISGRFVTTPVANGVMDVRIDLIDEGLTQLVTLVGLFAQTLTSQNISRRFRVALPGTFLLRRRTEATIAAQTLEIGWHISIERHL